MSEFIFPLVLSIVALWLIVWVFITYMNKDSQLIMKRGVLNTLLLSISVYGTFCAYIIQLAVFEDYKNVLYCSYSVYLNYIFVFSFLFSYFLRASAFVFDRHKNMIVSHSNEEQVVINYIMELNWVEKTLIQSRKLLKKIKNSTNKSTTIQDHFSEQRMNKPKALLKKLAIGLVISCLFGTIMLFTNIKKFSEPICPPYMILPIYLLLCVMTVCTIYMCFLLKSAKDPFFLKNEFLIVMGVVAPILFATGVVLRALAIQNANIPLIILSLLCHFVSVVVPNLISFKEKKQIFYQRKLSISSISSIENIKLKAAERFCLELALFKEDYDAMKLLKVERQIEQASLEIYSKYLIKDAPQELNLHGGLKKKIAIEIEKKNYLILDTVYKEVRLLLYSNLQIEL